jgi:hypothetical protein
MQPDADDHQEAGGDDAAAQVGDDEIGREIEAHLREALAEQICVAPMRDRRSIRP